VKSTELFRDVVLVWDDDDDDDGTRRGGFCGGSSSTSSVWVARVLRGDGVASWQSLLEMKRVVDEGDMVIISIVDESRIKKQCGVCVCVLWLVGPNVFFVSN
jgi:hypothetical protein